jgi:mono/diheme cytochrome c family protein
MKFIFGIGAALLAGAAAFYVWSGSASAPADPSAGAPSAEASATGEMVAVMLPELSGDALIGQRIFGARCAACHGPNAGGIEGAGPPLIHSYYVPSHHGDAAFFIAAERGVPAHHWRFGNMPPVEGITRAEVAMAVAFVRKVQRANGIE